MTELIPCFRPASCDGRDSRHARLRPRHRHFFTLIELLVVIAIISILAALLLPALGRAQLMAKKAADFSQLKGLGLGWTSYAVDNDSHLGAVCWSDIYWSKADIANNTNQTLTTNEWIEGVTAFMPWNLALAAGEYVEKGGLASPVDFGGTYSSAAGGSLFQAGFHSTAAYTPQILNRFFGTTFNTGAGGSVTPAYSQHLGYKNTVGGNSYYANMYLGGGATSNLGPGWWKRGTLINIERNGRPAHTMLAGNNGLGYHYWYYVPGYNTGTKQMLSWTAGAISRKGTRDAGSLPALGDNEGRSANYLIADGHVVNVPMPPDRLCKNINGGTNNTALFEWLSAQGVDVFANARADWPVSWGSPTNPWDGRSGWAYPW
jgi:prepilin-type N-terminal cleavage/methylation domain-containing protein